jgi:hypothetical protein
MAVVLRLLVVAVLLGVATVAVPQTAKRLRRVRQHSSQSSADHACLFLHGVGGGAPAGGGTHVLITPKDYARVPAP